MAGKNEELIDLNKLTQRELLILLHQDVKELKEGQKEGKEEIQELKIQVNSLETKSKVWGGVIGFFTAIGTIFFEKLIKP